MRAIIITDAEARSLLDALELAKLQEKDRTGRFSEEHEIAHRRFHLVVCRWLQEMGADVVRRG